MLIGQQENPSYCPSSSVREQSHLCHNPFFLDVLMTRSPEFLTHTLLDIVFTRIPSTLPFCIWILSTSSSTLVSTVAIIFGRNGIFICNVGSVWVWRKEDEDRRCKKEVSRLKMSWVVGIGGGSLERRSRLLSLSSIVVHKFWPWLQCARNWLGRQSCWWRHYVIVVKLLMHLWVRLVASCLASRRLVWPVYLPYQPTVCNKPAFEGSGNWNPYWCHKVGWILNGLLGVGNKTLIQEWSYKDVLIVFLHVFLQMRILSVFKPISCNFQSFNSQLIVITSNHCGFVN
jgi:hypothetical protein